jgi:osmotically-inducible protein OsmY
MTNRTKLAILICLLLLSGCLPAIIGTTIATGLITKTQDRDTKEIKGDTEIWVSIKNKFIQYNTKDLFSKVNVKVNEGRVLLSGNVKKINTKFLAEKIAWIPNGVMDVINEIEIQEQYKIKDITRDGLITTKVKTRLALEKEIKSNNYKIHTVNGIVYVIGITKSKYELSRALDLISQISGVRKVVNYMKVKNDFSEE